MAWVWTLGALTAGAFFLLCGTVIVEGKRDADRQADLAAANIVETVQKDIARTFEIFDLSLQGVLEAMSDPQIAQLTGRTRQIALFDYAAKATYLNAILILDENGSIVDDSRSLVPPKLDLADREFFKIHRDRADVGMYLSEPFISRGPNDEWVIAISRRISRPDGSFGGVVVGTVQLEYFESVFANLHLGSGGRLSLFRSDGMLVARHPFQLATIGKNFSKTTLFRKYPAAIAGDFESTPRTDGIPRRYIFAQVKNLPLVVVVGLAVADIYAPWRQNAYVIGALMAALVLMTLTLLIILAREFARRKQSEAKFRLLTDNSSDAIILKDLDGRRKYATPAYYAILGRSSNEMSDKRLLEFLDEESRESYRKTIERLRAGEQQVTESLRYSHPDGTWRWLEVTSNSVFDEFGKMREIVTNLRDVSRQKIAEDALAIAATTDGMTGLPNRRSFDQTLEREWRRASRSKSAIAMLMIDVDFFKAYNDTYGHLQGDEALKLVATCIDSNIRRPADLCARYGGEEFVVILPSTDAAGALRIAEKIRFAVSAQKLVHAKSQAGVVTISIGLTSVKADPDGDVVSIIQSTDAALYRAKQNGRNRTEQSAPDAAGHPIRLSA